MQRIARVVLVAILAVVVPSVGWAQQRVRVLSDGMEVPFTTDTVQAVATTDALYYRWVSVHVVTQGGSSTIAFQGSNDAVNWVSVSLVSATNIGAAVPAVSTTSASTILSGPVSYRYFRLNVTGIASGTTAGVVEFFAQAPVQLGIRNTADIASVTPTTGASNLGKGEDAVHTSGDVGVMILGCRNESASQTTNAATDYTCPSFDGYGAAFVRQDHPNRFSCGLDNIAATLTECQAAPSVGLSLYVTDIVAQSTTATAGQFILRQGTGTNCGTGTASVFPSAATVVRLAAPGNGVAPLVITFATPFKLTAINALCLLGVATNTVTAQINGFTAP